MRNLTFLQLIFLVLSASLFGELHAQGETELNTNGITFPKVSAAAVISPVEGQVIYDTDTDALAVYNGTAWVSATGSGFWQSSTHGIKYDNTDNIGIGVAANSGTKLIILGDYNEDPFRVQIGSASGPNIGSTKMRILAKYNAMVFGTSWNDIDSSHLNALWSNYNKNYFRDSLQLRTPSQDPAILMTRGSGINVFNMNGDNAIDLNRDGSISTIGLANLHDLDVSEEARFRNGIDAEKQIKIRTLGSGPNGPEIQFMDDNSTTTVASTIKVTNSTGGGNDHNMIFDNPNGYIRFQTNASAINFNMDESSNISHKNLRPSTNNNIDLGSSVYRWRNIYSNNTLNTSDVRLKKNINIISSSVLPDLMKLEVTTYNYKSDNIGSKKTIGFLAQEVEKINPEWVIPPAEEGDHYLLNYNNFTVLAVKAIQEQQVMIDALKVEIENLKKSKSE